MNLNEMQALWNSPGNRPAAAGQRQLVAEFTRRMIRRRRFQAVWLINTFVWLVLITGLAAWNVMANNVDLERQWALFPLIIVPWVFAFHFLRRFLNPPISSVRGELSVADGFRSALNSNRAEQSRLKLVGGLFGIMIPVLALCMWQLQTVGKVSPQELKSMAALLGGALLLSGAGIASRYFRRILPEQRQLRSLLEELSE